MIFFVLNRGVVVRSKRVEIGATRFAFIDRFHAYLWSTHWKYDPRINIYVEDFIYPVGYLRQGEEAEDMGCRNCKSTEKNRENVKCGVDYPGYL